MYILYYVVEPVGVYKFQYFVIYVFNPRVPSAIIVFPRAFIQLEVSHHLGTYRMFGMEDGGISIGPTPE